MGQGGTTNGATPLTQNAIQARANTNPTWTAIPAANGVTNTTPYALLSSFC